ncbi:MAG: tetratricopeptide repeat protein [Verrucomicrobiota bacterium]
MLSPIMRRGTSILILFGAVLLAYAPALWNGFVWDDTALVLRDPLIRSPRLIGEGFRHFLFLDATASDFYRPLQRVVYTLVYTLGGFTPWAFHLASLLVHGAAAVALYEFARRFLRQVGVSRSELLAFSVALLWAVHPVFTSAVTYVSGLADPLAAFFGFGGLALLIARRHIPAGVCLGAALFCKESGLFALLIGLGFAWDLARSESGPMRRHLAVVLRMAVPMLVLAGLYLGLRTTAERTPPPASRPVPAMERPVLALRAVAEYAGLLAAPVTLRMERDVRVPNGKGVLQTLAGGLVLLALGIWFRYSKKPTRQCLLAALMAYLPISNLFVLNATIAEHWIYIPSAFLFLAAASSAGPFLAQNARAARVAFAVFLVGVLALGFRTAIRCADWRNQQSFLHATIRDGGDSSRMLSNLASLKSSQGDLAGAIRDYTAALERKPDQPFAMLGLSGALIRQRSFNEARHWLERCEKIPLIRADALSNQAVLEFKESGRDRLDLLKEAASIDRRFWPLQKRYIGHLIERGQHGEAVRELRTVLEDQPFRSETWELLGRALEAAGSRELAGQALEEADRLDWHRARN